jgi:uncharacterized protein (TIGR03437 family)
MLNKTCRVFSSSCLLLAALPIVARVEAASPAFENDIAAQSPLVWYKLNEPAGSSLAVNSGSIGSSLNGIAFNSPTFGAAADGGDTGVAFANGNGRQQYIQTANNVPVSLQGNPTFTAEVLVYVPSNGQPSTPFYAPFLWWGGNGTGNSVYFSLSRLNFNQVFVGFYNSGLVMTGTINLDAWNLITWVRDSNGGTNNSLTGSTLYINGVMATTTSDTTLLGGGGILPAVQAGPITIERAGDSSRYFSGTVADAAVFGTALSASIIAQQYADLTSTALPSISQSSGIVSGASFQAGIVPGSWITISGTSLSSITDNWTNAIVNGALPTSLDGVKVSIGGEPAYIYYVSPTQINALAPNVGTGNVSVTVTNANGTSSAVTATVQTVQPAFFLWPGNYAVATTLNYGLAVKNGTFSGATTTPAAPGEVIVLWGTGFGPTNPVAPAGVATPSTTAYNTASPVTVTVGGVPATVYGAALAAGDAGLYQVAIQIPTPLANGDYPVVAKISGAQSPSTTLITVQN